jgi:hypothetical protein
MPGGSLLFFGPVKSCICCNEMCETGWIIIMSCDCQYRIHKDCITKYNETKNDFKCDCGIVTPYDCRRLY